MGVGDPIARQTKLNMGGSDPHVSQRFVLGDPDEFRPVPSGFRFGFLDLARHQTSLGGSRH